MQNYVLFVQARIFVYFRCLKNLYSSTSSDTDSDGGGQGELTAQKQ